MRVAHGKGATTTEHQTSTATSTATSNDAEAAGWTTMLDPGTNAYYYYNAATQQSSWTWPPQPGAEIASSSAASTVEGSYAGIAQAAGSNTSLASSPAPLCNALLMPYY